MDLDALFHRYKDPIELARKLVKVLGDSKALRPAAVKWIAVYANTAHKSVARVADGEAIHTLLSALEGGNERFVSWLRKARYEEDVRGKTTVRYHAALLDALVAIAPVRGAPEAEWLMSLLTWAGLTAENASFQGGKTAPEELSLLFHDDPELAYGLALAAQEGLRRMATHLLEMRSVRGAGVNEALIQRPPKRVAFLRLMECASPTDRDRDHLARLSVDDVLDDDWCFWIAHEALREGKVVPAAVIDATREARPPFDPRFIDGSTSAEPFSEKILRAGAHTRWTRSLQLLAATTDGLTEVPRLMARIIEDAPDADASLRFLQKESDGIFFSEVWKAQPEALTPIVSAMFKRNVWSTNFWERALAPWALSPYWRRSGIQEQRRDIVSNLVRRVLCAYLLQTAESNGEGPEVRKAAVAAVGELGPAHLVAPRLGRLTKDPVVSAEARKARAQLSKQGKGHGVPPEVALEMAVSTFTWARAWA